MPVALVHLGAFEWELIGGRLSDDQRVADLAAVRGMPQDVPEARPLTVAAVASVPPALSRALKPAADAPLLPLAHFAVHGQFAAHTTNVPVLGRTAGQAGVYGSNALLTEAAAHSRTSDRAAKQPLPP